MGILRLHDFAQKGEAIPVGKQFILVLASDMKRLSFMSMYEQDFVLQWVMSVSAAEELAKLERFKFALVNFDPDPQRAIQFCERLKTVQPQTRVIFLRSDLTPLPENFCADLVLDQDLSEHELASLLHTFMRQSA